MVKLDIAAEKTFFFAVCNDSRYGLQEFVLLFASFISYLASFKF
jgi:hypothetical protein